MQEETSPGLPFCALSCEKEGQVLHTSLKNPYLCVAVADWSVMMPQNKQQYYI